MGQDVWIVLDGDYDSSWVTAVYPAEGLAKHHAEELGGWVEYATVLTELHPDVTDPIKVQERAQETQKAHEAYERQQKHWRHSAALADALRPDPPRMSLCHCQVFSERPGDFWTASGYCKYCGGWDPQVFRQHMGDAALHEKISELRLWEREKMRQIVREAA